MVAIQRAVRIVICVINHQIILSLQNVNVMELKIPLKEIFVINHMVNAVANLDGQASNVKVS